jgi:hypothetical protein
LRNLHTDFHSDCINLHSRQQCKRVLFSMLMHQHWLAFVFLIIAILTEVRWNSNVVLICISFMAKGVEHCFMYLLAICTQSFLFNSFAHLLIGLFVFLVFNFLNSLYILSTNLLSDKELAKIFSHYVGCLFTLVIIYIAVEKLLI